MSLMSLYKRSFDNTQYLLWWKWYADYTNIWTFKTDKNIKRQHNTVYLSICQLTLIHLTIIGKLHTRFLSYKAENSNCWISLKKCGIRLIPHLLKFVRCCEMLPVRSERAGPSYLEWIWLSGGYLSDSYVSQIHKGAAKHNDQTKHHLPD